MAQTQDIQLTPFFSCSYAEAVAEAFRRTAAQAQFHVLTSVLRPRNRRRNRRYPAEGFFKAL